MSGTDFRTNEGTSSSEPQAAPPAKRKRWRLKVTLVLLLAVAVLATAGVLVWERMGTVGPVKLSAPQGMAPSKERARQLLGTPPSNSAWFSGSWAGGGISTTARYEDFGAWRGAPLDAATVYPELATWQDIADSNWHISTFTGFDGVLSYGLPLLSEEGRGDFRGVVRGDYDWVYEKVAADLIANGRGNTVVRIGWEPNGEWFPWGATAAQADSYKAAYRHVVAVLRRTAPDLIIDFDLSCGTSLRGQADRLDALNLLYPGDDAVDLVGCDFYDWYKTRSPNEQGWQQSLRPEDSVGIQDVADFARAHGKGLTFPEWGLASKKESGEGDNPFFIEKVRSFFEANSDILVLESYFSEPETSLANSIWDPAQMPKSAEVYARLW